MNISTLHVPEGPPRRGTRQRAAQSPTRSVPCGGQFGARIEADSTTISRPSPPATCPLDRLVGEEHLDVLMLVVRRRGDGLRRGGSPGGPTPPKIRTARGWVRAARESLISLPILKDF